MAENLRDTKIARRKLPPDWRDRLARALASDGVKSPWKRDELLFLWLFFQTLWILFRTLLPIAVVQIVGIWAVVKLVDADLGFSLSFVLPVLLAGLVECWWLSPRIHLMQRRMHSIRLYTRMSLKKAKSPPVLFLRPFTFDVDSAKVRGWLNRLPAHYSELTYELRLVSFIAKHAPVLALGRPGESDRPLGAARFYVPHDVWEKKVAEIVPLCRLVILATGRTEGLLWEIKYLVRHVAPRRLLLWVHVHVAYATAAQRHAQWSEFLAHHGNLFPRSLPQNVERSVFIAFGDDWTPRAIPGDDYSASLWERMAEHRHWYGIKSFLERKLG